MSKSLSALVLSWDAMLKMTEIELELIPDFDMYIFFEKGTKDGIYHNSNIILCQSQQKLFKIF